MNKYCQKALALGTCIFMLAAAGFAESIENLLEADRVEQDRLWREAHGGKKAEARFCIEHTREALDRTQALATRLAKIGADPAKLDLLATRLTELDSQFSKLEKRKKVSEERRREAYLAACRLGRDIAFCNPLLDFDQVLFVKRHDSAGVFHMCDQYYGFNAVDGGGLFVLSGLFTSNPEATNLLADTVVDNGRLEGQPLNPGSFLSPELSYDGKTILFAYTQGHGKDLEWTLESSHHVFSVGVDGTGLKQLTDGSWNDFDPCFLPNGRVVFVSERRGGYLRCGRHCPTYAMFSMAPDGSDIAPFSYHETHEWHPSVANDGRVVYTRWDYVDRDTNVAHHIWTCLQDGRDSRSLHGNYPERRETRPWMEMSIRAIPNSHKFVATAGAHHGHAFGSLVLIDQRPEDDGAMSQLTRLTPDVPFPESERHIKPIAECMVYGTAWPLSEDDYLCVYGARAKNRGIYWIDRFGNKELLYRDPAISCLSPIPLRPRPAPPVAPGLTGPGDAPATVAVMNVYDSDFDWPAETSITALRIIQILPKTTAPPNEPRIGAADQTNARAVLGTVPVESDGSAYFQAPTGKLIYFQALDEDGRAIQSMRSGAYLQPGEQMTCVGCHEPKRQAPPTVRVPIALQRTPSTIQPDADGSNPFNYVRLVQPVLDRNCVDCHRKNDALDLAGTTAGPHGWTQSYTNLAEKYGFYFHVRNGSIDTGVHGGTRTLAGEFGARVATLADYLDEDHYGVDLSVPDRHRVDLWLDCNSEFYGSYENTQAQSRGEIVHPTLD